MHFLDHTKTNIEKSTKAVMKAIHTKYHSMHCQLQDFRREKTLE